jgi:uncharacterized repeat protein (TIGR01451 family)
MSTMKFDLKKILLLVCTTLVLSCSDDDGIDPKTSSDLGISVEKSSDTPLAYDEMTFTFTATNNGLLDATSVAVKNEIASGYTFISAVTSSGAFDEVTGIWSIGDLENGAAATMILRVNVNESGDYNTTTTITGDQPDSVSSNNKATTEVNPKPLTSDLLFNYTISEGADPEVTITGLSDLWKKLSFPSKYDLIIPENIKGYPVRIIGERAFHLEIDLRSIVIPEGVTTLEELSLSYCYKLTNITIPASVSTIGKSALTLNYNLEEIKIPNKDAVIESLAFASCSKLKRITLPANLKVIEASLFNGCSSLESIEIPDSVEKIGDKAFENCSTLNLIALPKSLKEVGDYVFTMCSGLTSLSIAESNANFSCIDGVLCDKNATTLRYYPNGKSGAFSIPESVTKIGFSAFSHSYNLTGVTIPNSVTAIEDFAFWSCISLTTIVIPANITTIGKGAFSSNLALTNVIVDANVPPAINDIFSYTTKIASVKVPEGSVDAYKTALGWSNYKNIITGK